MLRAEAVPGVGDDSTLVDLSPLRRGENSVTSLLSDMVLVSGCLGSLTL